MLQNKNGDAIQDPSTYRKIKRFLKDVSTDQTTQRYTNQIDRSHKTEPSALPPRFFLDAASNALQVLVAGVAGLLAAGVAGHRDLLLKGAATRRRRLREDLAYHAVHVRPGVGPSRAATVRKTAAPLLSRYSFISHGVRSTTTLPSSPKKVTSKGNLRRTAYPSMASPWPRLVQMNGGRRALLSRGERWAAGRG